MHCASRCVGVRVDEILVVSGGEHAGDILKLRKNGKHPGVSRLEYTYQKGEGGIADAPKLAEGQKICVVLGEDTILGRFRHAAGVSLLYNCSMHITMTGKTA